MTRRVAPRLVVGAQPSDRSKRSSPRMMTTDHPHRSPRFRVAMTAAVMVLALSTCNPGFGSDGQDLAKDWESGLGASAERGNLPLDPSLADDAEGVGWSGQVSTPSPEPQAEPIHLPPVQTQRPKLRLEGWTPGPGRDVIAELMRVEGVAFATTLMIGDVLIGEGPAAVPVRFAGVDPEGFRVLTPQVTADAVEVWHRLNEGDAAFTHDAGHRLKLPLGVRVPAAQGQTVRVGAYASNGVPPVADAIVSHRTARALGLPPANAVLLSLQPGAHPDAVAKRVRQVTGLEPQVLQDPQTRRAFLSGASARKAFQPFSYIDNGDGMIQIDQGWVRRNIVYAKVPIFRGSVLCHRLMIDQLRGALQEVADKGLAHLIDPTQYGGCWVPRHIDFNPSRPLSMHAWGIAVDFNVSTNGLGQVPQMDRRIVQIFEKWGFAWGGHWKRPDGMHFELAALMGSSPQG